jgi:hypothetical protein
MGVFEFDKFAAGTNAVAQTLAECTSKVRLFVAANAISTVLTAMCGLCELHTITVDSSGFHSCSYYLLLSRCLVLLSRDKSEPAFMYRAPSPSLVAVTPSPPSRRPASPRRCPTSPPVRAVSFTRADAKESCVRCKGRLCTCSIRLRHTFQGRATSLRFWPRLMDWPCTVTGGGASLELLEGQILPGVAALDNA